jgi:hypothetical protein
MHINIVNVMLDDDIDMPLMISQPGQTDLPCLACTHAVLTLVNLRALFSVGLQTVAGRTS